MQTWTPIAKWWENLSSVAIHWLVDWIICFLDLRIKIAFIFLKLSFRDILKYQIYEKYAPDKSF